MKNTETKNCQNCAKDFTIEPEDFAFYEKMEVPPPTFCPMCRFQRRLMFKNERYLYNRECGLCGKNMLAAIHPDAPVAFVYCNSCWFTGNWGGEDYARDYDPNRNFLEQFRELMRVVPFPAATVNYSSMVGSEYTNYAGNLKNCYLIYDADQNENVLYSKTVVLVKDTMDALGIAHAELCYEVTMTGASSRVFFSDDCVECLDVYFSKKLSGCSYCFGCINLRNKKYCWLNEQLTKEEFTRRLSDYKLNTYDGITRARKETDAFFLSQPRKHIVGSHNDDVTGEYISHSKNAKDMYAAYGAENTRYCQFLSVKPISDSYDYTEWGNNASRIYECVTVGEGADNIRFSWACWLPGSISNEYSMYLNSSENMFGCVGMKKKKFCILNKEYSEDEFFKLRARIVKDMTDNPYRDAKGRVWKYGEFFPYDFSICGYNESVAQQYFPLSESEARGKGWSWFKESAGGHTITKKASLLPSDIRETSDEVLSDVVECEGCQKAYRIIKAELSLLRRFGFPLPRKCPNCRHLARLARTNKPGLYERTCQCAGDSSSNSIYKNTATHPHHGSSPCENTFQTSYAPRRPEIVYCEQCYLSEVA